MVTSNKRVIVKLSFHEIVSWKNHALDTSNFSSFLSERHSLRYASEKTNSARYGSQTICRTVARLKICVIKFRYNNTEKVNRKKLKSLLRASVSSTPRSDHTEDINDHKVY